MSSAFPEITSGIGYDRNAEQYYSHVESYGGMTLRQWYIGQALAGLATRHLDAKKLAADAASFADACMEVACTPSK